MADNTQDLNEMLQIRREKLHDLKEEGKDPHRIVNFKNRTDSKEIKDNFDKYEDQTASLRWGETEPKFRDDTPGHESGPALGPGERSKAGDPSEGPRSSVCPSIVMAETQTRRRIQVTVTKKRHNRGLSDGSSEKPQARAASISDLN